MSVSYDLQIITFKKNIYSASLTMQKFDCVDLNKLWKILKEMGIPDYLTYCLRNLCAGQEASVRTGHGTRECFRAVKGAWQGCALSAAHLTAVQSAPCRTPGWRTHSWGQDCREEYPQPQIRGWHHPNWKSEEELKSLLMRMKEESAKVGLKLDFQKPRIMASGPISSWQIDGTKVETVTDFIFLCSQITADSDCSLEIKRCLLLRKKAMTDLEV